jgi:ferredoxin
MKVVADIGVCKAYANCVMEAPDVFAISDETGKVELLVSTVPGNLEDEARQAVGACPSGALRIVEE